MAGTFFSQLCSSGFCSRDTQTVQQQRQQQEGLSNSEEKQGYSGLSIRDGGPRLVVVVVVVVVVVWRMLEVEKRYW